MREFSPAFEFILPNTHGVPIVSRADGGIHAR